MNPTDSMYILLDMTYKYANPNGFNFIHKSFAKRLTPQYLIDFQRFMSVLDAQLLTINKFYSA